MTARDVAPPPSLSLQDALWLAEFLFNHFGERPFTEEQFAHAFERYIKAVERAKELYQSYDRTVPTLSRSQKYEARCRLAFGHSLRAVAKDLRKSTMTIRKLL